MFDGFALLCSHIGGVQSVEQRRLSVVHLAHHRNHQLFAQRCVQCVRGTERVQNEGRWLKTQHLDLLVRVVAQLLGRVGHHSVAVQFHLVTEPKYPIT